MDPQEIEVWAQALNEARLKAQPLPQISTQRKSESSVFTRADAYSIQEWQMKKRLGSGEKQLGWKMGLTSEAKRRQMNLDSPLYGFLTDKMKVEHQGIYSLKGKIHPKIEPELAFWIKKDLQGSVSREEVLEACAGVCACMEILDSRYQQFKYFSMEDVISDNSSSCDFVIGTWKEDFRKLDLTNLPMRMFVNGELAQEGSSKDISGDPVQSVVQLCQLLAERNQLLKAGSLVLAGAATAAVELKPGMQIKLEVEGFESVSVSVSGDA